MLSSLKSTLLFVTLLASSIQAFAWQLSDVVKDCQENKNSYACFLVGSAFETGYGGTIKNLEKSNKYYDKSCAGGVHEACLNLGNNYFTGVGLPANISPQEKNKVKAKGIKLWKKSCELGSYKGCMSYGGTTIRFANGAKLAVESFERACKLGYAKGCQGAAEIYRQGRGKGDGVVKQNLQKSNELLSTATEIVERKKVLDSLAANADSKVFKKIAREDNRVKYQLNSSSTAWEAQYNKNMVTLLHAMTDFPDSPFFRNFVRQQNETLKSNLYITKFPNQSKEYLAISKSFKYNAQNNNDNFTKNALLVLADLNRFIADYKQIRQ